MSTTAMHLQAAPATQQTCEQCGTLFTPKRSWSRFCRTGCRNAWHQAMHPDAVREARELVRLALEGCDPLVWNPRARKLLGVK